MMLFRFTVVDTCCCSSGGDEQITMFVACEACDAADVLKNEHDMLMELLNVVLHSFDTFEADCSRRALLLVICCDV